MAQFRAFRRGQEALDGLARTEKTCRDCGETKPLEAFVKNKKAPDGRQYWCKACKQATQRANYTTENGRRAYYKVQYGITPEDFDRMLEAQDGKCAICGREDSTSKIDPSKAQHKSVHRLHIDHDHTTGEIRALLCGTCNRGIGSFHENPELLEAAARYLRRWVKQEAS